MAKTHGVVCMTWAMEKATAKTHGEAVGIPCGMAKVVTRGAKVGVEKAAKKIGAAKTDAIQACGVVEAQIHEAKVAAGAKIHTERQVPKMADGEAKVIHGVKVTNTTMLVGRENLDQMLGAQ